MAVALDTENELLSSLSKKRSEFRNSFKLKSLNQTEQIPDDANSVTTSSLTFTETANDLMSSLRERRLKRRTLLSPITNLPTKEYDVTGITEGNDDSTQTVSQGIRKLKALRNTVRETRFDSDSQLFGQRQRPLPTLSTTVPSSNIVPQKSSHRWRMLSAQLGVAKNKTIEQRSFDFFTGRIDDDIEQMDDAMDHQTQGEVTMTTTATLQPTENEEMIDSGDGDEIADNEEQQSVLLQEDHSTLFNKQTLQTDNLVSKAYNLYEYNLPTYIPYQLKVSREQQLYFIPETVPVPPEHKTPGNAHPIYIEESGMYIGHRPKVSPSNQAIMENRLLKRPNEGAGWFGNDGLLKVQPDPTAPLITRPLIIGYEENRQVVYEQIPTVAINNQYLIRSKQNNDVYQMLFNIGQLQFKHHPLFSVEHVLASHLIEISKKRDTVNRHQMIEHLRQKLHAMEYTVHNMRQSLAEVDAQGSTTDVITSQLINYKNEMSEIWQQIKQLRSTEYRLVKNILEIWRDIKRIREEQTYSCTNVKVAVQRILPDISEDENQWERDIQFELNEQRTEFEAANEQRVSTYNIQLSQWKEYERKRRRAQRHQDRTDGYSSSVTDGSVVSDITNSEQIDTVSIASFPPPEKPRPVAPPLFNEEERRIAIVENYRSHFRKPGEPILIPQLSFNHPVTQQCPREEQLRRNEISVTKYRIRILYNNKEICSTRDNVLSNDFSVKFNELLKVEVIEWPKAITFQVQFVNSSTLLSSTMTEVFVPIPDSSITTSSTSLEDYSFSVHHKLEYNHNGVGAGQCHPLIPNNGVLITGGIITASVCWGETQDGKPLSPLGLNKSSGIIGNTNDVHKIKQWIEESRLDPNDPRNFELFDLLKTVPSSATYFRLQSLDDLERLISDKEFKENKRFNLLQLREQGHPALKGKSIPLDEESITESFWKTVQDYKPYGLSELPVTIFGNFYDEHNKEREKYLIEIREKVLTRTGKRSHGNLTLEDVIHEELIPNIGSLKNSLLELISPRQPLKPKRKPRHKPKPQNVHVEECHISIRVVRVINVPLRGISKSLTQLPTTTDQTKQSEEGSIVKPFIEVSFGNERKRTLTSTGPQPNWNEEIILPFHPPQSDFSPVSLQKVTDQLRFDLYDETTIDLLQDERNRETDLHHRIENKWLGVLAIPFTTLHAQTRIEGTFQMDTPPFVIGYHHSTDDTVYIQLFVSLEPALGILPPITEKFDSAEDTLLLEKASVWLKTLRARFPSRNYQTTVLDVSGKNVFLSRFVCPQNPPPELLPADYKTQTGNNLLLFMVKLSWFVSLIPSLPDAVLFSGTCNIWTTTNQFLHMLGGDEEEHAVLLCNYFLYIGQDAWIILGHAIPEGPTAYVLTSNPLDVNSYTLWNPTTGSHFAITQSYLPLINIGTVINNANIWGNNQDWEHPGQVNFDFNNSKHWTPLFSNTMDPLPSIQVERLDYSQTDIEHVQLLQSRIDQIIHSHIENLRVRHLTRWNRYCSRKLQDILPKFEDTMYASSDLQFQHYQELIETFPAYNIHGYPLNLRCSNTKHLIEAIEHAGFHLCEHERVEFGLGVYVHCYPNNIISIWVYLMTLVPISV